MAKLSGDAKEITEFVDTDWNKSVLKDAAEYCTSDGFMNEILIFKEIHADIFIESSESKGDDEHSLIFTDVFNEYQQLIDRKLSAFVEENGITMLDFYAECRDAMDGKFTVLFEEHEDKWFVDLLMDWLDYNHFYEGMVTTARLSASKSSTSSHK